MRDSQAVAEQLKALAGLAEEFMAQCDTCDETVSRNRAQELFDLTPNQFRRCERLGLQAEQRRTAKTTRRQYRVGEVAQFVAGHLAVRQLPKGGRSTITDFRLSK